MKSRDILFSSLFVVFYLVLFFSVEAQVKSSRGTLGYTFEEKKRDARTSGGSVFTTRGHVVLAL